MIISYSHKYIFVKNPRSGSSYIEKKLVKHYGGELIFDAHSSLHAFSNINNINLNEYLIFTSIRNPISSYISKFEKKKNNRHNFDSVRVFNFRKVFFDLKDYFEFQLIKIGLFSFKNFIRFSFPYTDLAFTHKDRFDYFIRMENLEDDFEKILKKLNLKPVHDTNPINVTKKSSKKIMNYYNDVQIRKIVFKKTKIYMDTFGYKCPDEFEKFDLKPLDKFIFKFTTKLRFLFRKHIFEKNMKL